MADRSPEGLTESPLKLDPTAQASLSFQAYPNAPEIDGVWVHELRKNRSENGWLLEYARIAGGHLLQAPSDLEVRQINVSRALPQRINAFHIHPKRRQNEIWTVVQGQLVVWLVDCRAGSRTGGVRRRLILTEEQPAQLHIPAGVAHGYKAGPDGAILLYSADQQFNRHDPDEGRLAWDFFGAAMWDEDRG